MKYIQPLFIGAVSYHDFQLKSTVCVSLTEEEVHTNRMNHILSVWLPVLCEVVHTWLSRQRRVDFHGRVYGFQILLVEDVDGLDQSVFVEGANLASFDLAVFGQIGMALGRKTSKG
jgi:hypothetical protein